MRDAEQAEGVAGQQLPGAEAVVAAPGADGVRAPVQAAMPVHGPHRGQGVIGDVGFVAEFGLQQPAGWSGSPGDTLFDLIAHLDGGIGQLAAGGQAQRHPARPAIAEAQRPAQSHSCHHRHGRWAGDIPQKIKTNAASASGWRR